MAVLIALLAISCGLRVSGAEMNVTFPDGFVFGVSTAAYKIEGGWDSDGKGESIWDRYTHENSEMILDHSTGDVASDSYHLFREDVRLLQELGVDFYRFSIAWTRILPTGHSNRINPAGIKYYNDLIDELISHNITPYVTMFHYDTPQKLQDLGGWTNPLMIEYFVEYAKILFDTFGDRVKHWVTFNEPRQTCLLGYGTALYPPGLETGGVGEYLCTHHVLKAHGLVYRMYDRSYRNAQNGKITMTIDTAWYQAATASKEDIDAAEKARQFYFGWFAHPIFSKTGDYPPVMREIIDTNSRAQNFSKSRLPSFSRDEIDMIRGSGDFFSLNSYTTYLVAAEGGHSFDQPSFVEDLNVRIFQNESWPVSESPWLKIVPWGLRKLLNWVRREYDNPPLLMTESGVSLEAGLEDEMRVSYLLTYLRQLAAAIREDGCNLIGYSYWTLLDSFEWKEGYTARFGLYEVELPPGNRSRTARRSAAVYRGVLRARTLPAARPGAEPPFGVRDPGY